MSYDANNDFLGLLRLVNGGVRTERMPGLDYVIAAFARVGLITLAVSQTAPTVNTVKTVWLKPSSPSWTYEGVIFLWNATNNQYEPATPALWAALFIIGNATFVTQDVTTVGPVNIQVNAGVVRVQNVGAPVSLVMPLSANMLTPVLISDWANHAGTTGLITISTTGGEVFPGGVTSWQIGGDGGSVFLRPVSGGYAL